MTLPTGSTEGLHPVGLSRRPAPNRYAELSTPRDLHPQKAPQLLELRRQVTNADGAMVGGTVRVPVLDEPPAPLENR